MSLGVISDGKIVYAGRNVAGGVKGIDASLNLVPKLVNADVDAAAAIDLSKLVSPRFKVGNFTRDTSLASGTQAVTGVGFKPSAVIFFANTPGTYEMSIGVDLQTAYGEVHDNSASTSNTYDITTSQSIVLGQGIAIVYLGYIQSMDADGFTISWTKAGAKTGTATIIYLAPR